MFTKNEEEASNTDYLEGDLQDKSSEKNMRGRRKMVPTTHLEKLPQVHRKIWGKESRSAGGKEVMNDSVRLC